MKQVTAWIAVFLLSIIGLMLFMGVMGLRINLTDSIPIGLYRMKAIKDVKNIKQAYVIFCPDDKPVFQQARDRGYINHGLCPGGYGYLMKKVVATPGDQISVMASGVFVNQRLIPYSKPKARDGVNRALPQWPAFNYQLKDDECMTMTSQSAWSFDSRYYGPVRLGQIKGVITPLWGKAQNWRQDMNKKVRKLFISAYNTYVFVFKYKSTTL
jgi:conjugative transfer signal peptidase TraF